MFLKQHISQELQKCFDTKDIGMLQEVLTAMKPEEAQVWLKKCIDSGLWVPGPSDDSEDAPPPEQCKSSLVASPFTSPSVSQSCITDGARAVDVSPGIFTAPTKSCSHSLITHIFMCFTLLAHALGSTLLLGFSQNENIFSRN